MPQQHDNDTLRTVFSLLLPKQITDNIHIQEMPEKIIISGKQNDILNIQKTLQNKIADPKSIYAELPYKITSATTSQALTEPEMAQKPIAPEDTMSAKELLKTLFGRTALKPLASSFDGIFDTEVDLGAPNEEARATAGTLYSMTISEEYKKHFETYAQYLTKFFSNQNVATIRAAYLGKKPLSAPSESEKAEEIFDITEGVGRGIFGLISVGEGKWKLYFAYHKLYELLFPFTLSLETVGAQEAKLHIDRRHFLNYLSQIFENGTLLKVYHVDNEIGASPIFINPLLPANHDFYLYLLLDISGSMKSKFEDYTKGVIQFCKDFFTKYPNATLVVRTFHSKRGESITFKKTGLEKLIEYFSQLEAGHHTALYDAITAEIETIEKAGRLQQSAFVFFTDGKDTKSEKKLHDLGETIQRLREKNHYIPPIFALGYGENYDAALLTAIAEKTGGKMFPLNTLDFNELRQLDPAELMATVIQKFVHSDLEFSVPVRPGIVGTQIIIPFSRTHEDISCEFGDANHKIQVSIPHTFLSLATTHNTAESALRYYQGCAHYAAVKSANKQELKTSLDALLTRIEQNALLSKTQRKELLSYINQIENNFGTPRQFLAEGITAKRLQLPVSPVSAALGGLFGTQTTLGSIGKEKAKAAEYSAPSLN